MMKRRAFLSGAAAAAAMPVAVQAAPDPPKGPYDFYMATGLGDGYSWARMEARVRCEPYYLPMIRSDGRPDWRQRLRCEYRVMGGVIRVRGGDRNDASGALLNLWSRRPDLFPLRQQLHETTDLGWA